MAGAVVHDCVGALPVRDGRVLLGRRADDRAWLPGAWDVFGGHLEPGETPEDALRRELAEELGIEATEWRALSVLDGDSPAGRWRLRLFALTGWHGEPRNRDPREHAALRWCTREEAATRLAQAHSGFADAVAAALEKV